MRRFEQSSFLPRAPRRTVLALLLLAYSPILVLAAGAYGNEAILRVYMFSGDGDNGGFAAGNQALSDALTSKGNPWRYVYGVKSTHDNHFAASLITEALLWTWAGYPL